MEFCPDCGKMLMPKNGKIKCRCGYEKSLTDDDIEEQYHMEGETNPQAKVIVTDRNTVPSAATPGEALINFNYFFIFFFVNLQCKYMNYFLYYFNYLFKFLGK